MNVLVDRIWKDLEQEHLMVFESEPAITLGRNTKPTSLRVSPEELGRRGIELIEVNRGGDATWHGPGQLVVFPLINIRHRDWDVYRLVDLLIGSISDTLSAFGVPADPPEGEIGVWVGGYKIANIGLWHERGIVSHGLALNVNPDFGWIECIHPCGDAQARVTSLANLLHDCPRMEVVKRILLDRLRRKLSYRLPLAPGQEQPWANSIWSS